MVFVVRLCEIVNIDFSSTCDAGKCWRSREQKVPSSALPVGSKDEQEGTGRRSVPTGSSRGEGKGWGRERGQGGGRVDERRLPLYKWA